MKQQAARAPADGWIVGFGYQPRQMKDGRTPTIEELDGVAADRPLDARRVEAIRRNGPDRFARAQERIVDRDVVPPGVGVEGGQAQVDKFGKRNVFSDTSF